MPLRHLLTKLSSKVPLRAVLIVPFVIQIVAAVGLTGYLSLRNGQTAVNQVADELRREITNRIEERLRSYLDVPAQVNQFNADMIEQGLLDISDLSQLDDYLLRQIRQFDQLTSIAITTTAPDYVEVITFDRQAFTINVWNKAGTGILQWTIDQQGNRSETEATPTYDHRQRPWWRDTLRLDRPNWSRPFAAITPQRLIISLNQPIYNPQGEAIGVIGSDLSLLAIRDFLNSLKIGETGETFIIERDGSLIAASTSELPFRSLGEGKAERLLAIDSDDPLVRATARHLQQEFGSFHRLNQAKLEFATAEGHQQFLQVMPFQDPRGIDWLVIVVIPEADFMEQIHANTRLTLLLCAVALGAAIAFGIATAHWITKPIMQLSRASASLAKGDWDRPVDIQRSGELGVLSQAFNDMREELKQSHRQLEEYSRGLEQKNQQLATLEAELRKQLNLFLHAVSHDLRNPVIGTSMVLDGLSQQPGDEVKLSRRVLERMIEGNQRQLDLINSLIDTHATETWGIVLHRQPIVLHELVEAATADLQPILERDNAVLQSYIAPDLPLIDGDALQLVRVYQNLIANALKHNPPGLTLILEAKPTDNQLHCTVTDDGIGIPPEQCDRLFDPYFRGSQNQNRLGWGWGFIYVGKLLKLTEARSAFVAGLGKAQRFGLRYHCTSNAIVRL